MRLPLCKASGRGLKERDGRLVQSFSLGYRVVKAFRQSNLRPGRGEADELVERVSRKGEQEAPAAARSKGTGLESGRYLCLLAVSELPSQFVNDEAIEALRSARERLASLPLTPDERPLIGLVLASIDRARGLLYPAPGETDSTAAWLDEAEAAHRYQGALDLLHDRRIKALRINDDIVQRLAMAKLALDLNRPGESSILLEEALVASRQIISDLTSAHAGERGLGPGDLRTERSEEQ